MARPKEFDQEKALRTAIHLFSQQGFAATSTDDLMRVMEVGRQTLMRVLTRAKKQREIRSDADLDSMADFFESTLAGIRMAAKAGKSRHALRNIAAFASRAYTASDRRITPE